MKLVSFLNKNHEERLGLWINGQTFDLAKNALALSLKIPSVMLEFLNGGSKNMALARRVEKALVSSKKPVIENKSKIIPLAPVPHPRSCRDAYAFRQHVAAARRSRGIEMIPEYDQFPVFYFTNHNSICGEGPVTVEKDHLEKLDFELEAAIVIGKGGKNIKMKDADSYIAGYMIMNDLSARLLQSEEMKLNLGPAKGKDFATATGPWLVTPDELESLKIKTPVGNKYNLSMKAYHNGKQVSEGNLKDMSWTFAQIIERCSYGVDLLPGDVIGSGTVGTGCYMELNGTHALKAKEEEKPFSPVWLKGGDMIELEITGLGRLKNTIVKSRSSASILRLNLENNSAHPPSENKTSRINR